MPQTPPESTCPAAWHGGLRTEPLWARWGRLRCIDRAGYHALLRAAGLPYAELRRMAGDGSAYLSERGTLVPLEAAELLLGRIAWDHWYGERGIAFHEDAVPTADAMGADQVRAWFVARP